MASQKTDLELVKGYLAGQSDANLYVEESIRIAFKSWRDRFWYQTDDILSDSRYKLYSSLERGDFAGKSSLRAYISGIVRHTCLDYYRAQKRIKTVDIEESPLLDATLSAQEKLEKREVAFLNFRVMRLSSKECLSIWRLQFKEDMKCREIGERLGKSEVNIRGRLMKCRRQAKVALKRLIIIPTGRLHYLPFEALIDNDNRFLVQSFDVSYAPSVSVLHNLQERRSSSSAKNLVAFGDPVLVNSDFAPLKYSRDEVQKLIDLYGAEKVMSRLGDQATESAFRAIDFNNIRYVHLATHGICSERRPDRPAILCGRSGNCYRQPLEHQ